MAALVAEFNAYLEREHADPTADLVGYRQIPLWLTQAEVAELISEVRSIIVSRTNNEPAPDRRMYLLSPILFPIEELQRLTTDKQADHLQSEAKGSAARVDVCGQTEEVAIVAQDELSIAASPQ